MTFFTKSVSLFLGLFLMAGTLFAQGQQQMMQQQQPEPIPADSVTEADLNQFVAIYKEFQPIMMEAQKKQMQMVQEADSITVQRFNEIMRAQQTGQMQNMQLTEVEKRAIQRLQPKMMQLRQQIQKQQMQIIQGSEMGMTRFQRMDVTIGNNPEIAKKVKSMLSDTTGTGNGGNR